MYPVSPLSRSTHQRSGLADVARSCEVQCRLQFHLRFGGDCSEHTVLLVAPSRSSRAVSEPQLQSCFEVIQFTSAASFSRFEVLLLGSAILKVPSSSLPPPGTSLQERA